MNIIEAEVIKEKIKPASVKKGMDMKSSYVYCCFQLFITQNHVCILNDLLICECIASSQFIDSSHLAFINIANHIMIIHSMRSLNSSSPFFTLNSSVLQNLRYLKKNPSQHQRKVCLLTFICVYTIF